MLGVFHDQSRVVTKGAKGKKEEISGPQPKRGVREKGFYLSGGSYCHFTAEEGERKGKGKKENLVTLFLVCHR